MAGGRQRQLRRKARRGPPIHKLSDDVVLEIFLGLPSLGTLVRAAFTCRPWRRAVASSPAFRRRFRALHPSPLLGLFFEAPGPAQIPNVPAFAPTRPRDRDLAAAVRGGDFFLTSLQDGPSEIPCWDVIDCSRGYVLLLNWDDEILVVMNPLTRRRENAFDHSPHDVFDGSFGPTWKNHPWVEVPAPVRSDDDNRWVQNAVGMHLLVSLDTVTMKFSVIELPQCLRNSSFDVGETKQGATCIVYSDQLNIGVLMHIRDDDGGERWLLDRLVPLGSELARVLRCGLDDDRVLNNLVDNPDELFVLAVQDGYVYLATSLMHHDPRSPCWFLSLCLETMKLERLFRRTFDNIVHPYIMEWPPCLVGNYGKFALEDAL
ncbi:hypothetical protein SETIT_5G217600v2 [Setaria italica]|uniref:F-box domain-containing protein n=1 Tax=Setaria italica TaxID=4555 RepID=A0A368R7C9_SETIT|nr:hypothetical protein SETIT_5G217600v2 [Setaria italica]